jgi:hypothetical protein
MRYFLAAAMLAAFALPAQSAALDEEAELTRLEQRLQPLALVLSGATSASNVRAIIGPKTSDFDVACDEICFERLNFTGGDAVPYTGLFDRYSDTPATKDDAPRSPVTAYGWQLWLWIDARAAPGLCFSVEGWNAALTAAGWPALTPSLMTYTVRVSDNAKVLKDNDAKAAKAIQVSANIFTSHKENRRIKLSTGPDILLGQVNSSKDVAVAQALDDCVRAVTAENW